ncbi:hypothetical protein TBLA_0A07890 [Henningerozyma blattae CBS 6284]|uniref:Cyclin-like domain-containing protein n=1 Tax=Henningerozyma blattae (strain ATCC 34711 / CBS 6284 / DSM 70876 / NBRC 10599 / NRRL Y-10934 / UCD 77-7) TaxID=1071380 RepID=I2GWS6_HENB6|nr:hypothetical protein TBLA_0A07890 [Tetrapisispora blattae CBS 6284]CCH58578.1 hypothetical protein TBLA_0A07890 [Tetrapisispora blattae CBS 6284]
MQEYVQAFNVLMKSPVTDDIIRYVTNCTLKVLPHNNGSQLPSPPSSPVDGKAPSIPKLPSLMTFITRIVRYTNVQVSTLLMTVCYLNKLKKLLPADAVGIPSTIHRLFLACLILSAKFHNDSSPLNVHWANYTNGLFSVKDVNLMERQLLSLLDWNLQLTEHEIILDLQSLLEPIVRDIVVSKHLRAHSHTRSNSRNFTHSRNNSTSSSYLLSLSSSPLTRTNSPYAQQLSRSNSQYGQYPPSLSRSASQYSQHQPEVQLQQPQQQHLQNQYQFNKNIYSYSTSNSAEYDSFKSQAMHKRDLSISSNLSTSTLVDQYSPYENLPMFGGKISPLSTNKNTSPLLIGGLDNWDFDQVMRSHGF